jgi:DNA-binding NarL/FixJ family response regulator
MPQEGAMPPIHVAVVASSETVREGLEALLGACADLRVVSAGPRNRGLAGRRPGSQPACDVLVVAEGRGLQAAPAPAAAPAVVCLSEDPRAAARLAAAGYPAWALLGPAAGREQLAAAVRAVHRGLVVLTPSLAAGLLPPRPAGRTADGLGERPGGAPPDGEPRLTPREREVLALLAQGLGNKQIAWELAVSEHTVKYHVSSLYAKLGAGSRTEALRLGIERGLLSL